MAMSLHRIVKHLNEIEYLAPGFVTRCIDLFLGYSYGRGFEIPDQRGTIKLNTLAMRRKMHYDNRNNLNLMS